MLNHHHHSKYDLIKYKTIMNVAYIESVAAFFHAKIGESQLNSASGRNTDVENAIEISTVIIGVVG